MDEHLIDRIYDCAFVPEQWPSVLDAIAEIADARGGYLLTSGSGVHHWTASDAMRAAIEVVVEGGWLTRGQRFVRLAAARRHGFVTEYDMYTDEEMAADPFYRDLLWSVGLGWAAGNMLHLPTGDALIFGVERRRKRGPIENEIIERLDMLYPHIARSALIAARLHLERARTASETLALLGLPAMVFGPSGKVLAANHIIEPMTEHIRWHSRDLFSLNDRAANVLLQNAIAGLGLDHARSTRSFALRGADGQAAMVGHVIPLRGTSRDVFLQSAGVFVLTPVAMPKAPPDELIQSLFDLTPAEARVARSLTVGTTVDGIASDFGISRNTVRSHVRGALEKTGCVRQAELVALLSGITKVV